MLRQLVDTERFPAVTALFGAPSIGDQAEHDAYDDQADFRFGLERVLDGLETLLRARGG